MFENDRLPDDIERGVSGPWFDTVIHSNQAGRSWDTSSFPSQFDEAYLKAISDACAAFANRRVEI